MTTRQLLTIETGADLARSYLAIKSAIGRQTVVDLAAAWAIQP